MRRFLESVYLAAVATVLAATAVSCSSGKERDPYLRSLGIKADTLMYSDSFNIDRYDLFQARDVVKVDDNWILLSSSKGDYNLLFVNLSAPEHFFAIRRGRGPGEMIQGGSLHKSGKDAVYYDVNSATCIRINCAETIDRHEMAADTVGIFSNGSRPVYMTSCGSGGFISGNMSDMGVWYSYYDAAGNILSGVGALRCDGISDKDDKRLFSMMFSSKYVSSPDGSKVCVANVPTASLSFSEVDSGKLTEYKRYECSDWGTGVEYFGPDAISAFHGMDADDENVYVIYSGHKIKDDVLPANECRHLVVYDWDGSPVKHYLLNRNVSSVHVDGDTLWCASTYPESCVYKFSL